MYHCVSGHRKREWDVFHHKIERFILLWHAKNNDHDNNDDNYEHFQNYENIDGKSQYIILRWSVMLKVVMQRSSAHWRNSSAYSGKQKDKITVNYGNRII